jgi:Domain of unknown function (DUF4234)
MVLILTYVTCGIYGLYWQYLTTQELSSASGRTELNPGLELVLSVLTCGLFSLYVYYRNAELIHNTLTERGIVHENKTQTVLLLVVASFFVGITAWIPPLLLQDEYNKLAPPA